MTGPRELTDENQHAPNAQISPSNAVRMQHGRVPVKRQFMKMRGFCIECYYFVTVPPGRSANRTIAEITYSYQTLGVTCTIPVIASPHRYS